MRIFFTCYQKAILILHTEPDHSWSLSSSSLIFLTRLGRGRHTTHVKFSEKLSNWQLNARAWIRPRLKISHANIIHHTYFSLPIGQLSGSKFDLSSLSICVDLIDFVDFNSTIDLDNAFVSTCHLHINLHETHSVCVDRTDDQLTERTHCWWCFKFSWEINLIEHSSFRCIYIVRHRPINRCEPPLGQHSWVKYSRWHKISLIYPIWQRCCLLFEIVHMYEVVVHYQVAEAWRDRDNIWLWAIKIFFWKKFPCRLSVC